MKTKTLSGLSIVQLFVVFNLTIQAQAPGIQWQKTIGGDDTDELIQVVQTNDNGYILQGVSFSEISGDKTADSIETRECWLVKLDSTGQTIQWQGIYKAEFVNTVVQTSDSGYLLGLSSFTYGYPGLYDYYLIKTDDRGNIQWTDTIGGAAYDEITAIIETSDKGFLIGGSSESDNSADKTFPSRGGWDIWLVKLDWGHKIQWQKAYGGNGDDYLKSMYATQDGGYILGCQSNSPASGEKEEASDYYDDYWIIKTDSAGNIVRQNTIQADYADYLFEAIPSNDGGFFLAGRSYSDVSGDKTVPLVPNSLGNPYREVDYWVLKTDSLMEIQWQKVFGGGDEDEIFSACSANGNGFLLGGWSRSGIEGNKTVDRHDDLFDAWLVRIDSMGNDLWQKILGTDWGDELCSVIQCSDSGFIAGIKTGGGISFEKSEESRGDLDYWIVKLEPENNQITNPTGVTASTSNYSTIEIYPDPVSEYFTINYHLEQPSDVSIRLYNLKGNLLENYLNNEFRSSGEHNESFRMNSPIAGIFVIEVITEKGIYKEKVVIQPGLPH